MVFLGILLNGKCHKLMVPEDKVNSALQLINRICSKKKATVKELQTLAGTLNFLHKAIVPDHAFTRRIYNKYHSKINEKKLNPYHHISLDLEFRNDCSIWRQFLINQDSLCRPFIDLDEGRTDNTLSFFMDASKVKNLGFGCYFNKRWSFGQWEKNFIEQEDPSIAYLELYALCAGVFIWEQELANMRIVIFCDNESVIHMVNNSSSKCRTVCISCIF